MGTVYLAGAPGGEPVAVKVVRADLARDPAFVARFAAEVTAARRVSGPCTARVLDASPEGGPHGAPYLVTEYVEGPTLERAVRVSGPLPASHADGFALGTATALTAIHAAGLVHRDLKPGNVLLSRYGPRVVDFGIARALDATSGLTRVGEVVGTPGWMAPEQLRGLPATPATDVFVWGSLVTYAATGRNPYGEGDVPVLTSRLLHGRPDLAGLPPTLRARVEAAMDPDPGRRPTARDLLLGMLGATGPGPAGAAAPAAAADPQRAATALLARTWPERTVPAGATMPAAPYPAAPHPAPPFPAPPHPVSPYPAAGPPGQGPPPAPGWPPPRRRRRWFARKRVLIPLGLVLLLLAAGLRDERPTTGGGAAGAPAGGTSTPSPGAARPTPGPTRTGAATAPRSSPVRAATDGKLRFELLRTRCGIERLGTVLVKQAEGQLCVLSLRVRNVGDESRRVFVGSQVLSDARGNEYKADEGAGWYHAPAGRWGAELNPGIVVQGDLVYDVPDGVTFTALTVRDSFLSRGTRLPLT